MRAGLGGLWFAGLAGGQPGGSSFFGADSFGGEFEELAGELASR